MILVLKKKICSLIKVKGYTKGNLLNKGSEGLIYESNDWTIKISNNSYNFNTPEGVIQFLNLLREMAYYYLFSKRKIGPRIPEKNAFYIYFDQNSSNSKWAIITLKYKVDVSNLLYEISEDQTEQEDDIQYIILDIGDKLKNILEEMLDIGVLCGDIKPANFLVNYDWDLDTPIEIVATDFGGDWCCNLYKRPVCNIFVRNDFDISTKKYIILLQCLSLCVDYWSKTNKTLLFKTEMITLMNLIKNKKNEVKRVIFLYRNQLQAIYYYLQITKLPPHKVVDVTIPEHAESGESWTFENSLRKFKVVIPKDLKSKKTFRVRLKETHQDTNVKRIIDLIYIFLDYYLATPSINISK